MYHHAAHIVKTDLTTVIRKAEHANTHILSHVLLSCGLRDVTDIVACGKALTQALGRIVSHRLLASVPRP